MGVAMFNLNFPLCVPQKLLKTGGRWEIKGLKVIAVPF
uniref:Uncharacterized protein n=1 Tax=Anguilla anguilla TaxID=7936 RepID=A0A0E9PAH2_ANGAN